MSRKRFLFTASLGCTILILLLIIVIPMTFFMLPFLSGEITIADVDPLSDRTPVPGARETQVAIPTFTAPARLSEGEPTPQADPFQPALGVSSDFLTQLYDKYNPGVVNIQVNVDRGVLSGQGAGSGFVLSDEGHIVTNNHVVAEAEQVTVIFYNEVQADAKVIGTDDDSDLAVIEVDRLPEDVRPLNLADSDDVNVGEWVVAIGNPFGQQSSMSIGIVSAVGRTIPSGVTRFAIPEAIQTDAAINPGNSGGPLLNLRGEVIGVNAQIATGGLSNSGVGFAIPANVVRQVVPVLIEVGRYQWPWLGVEGGNVNLAIMQANNLETQSGAYIAEVVPDGPADKAGLQGTSRTEEINGIEVPVGGDVVIAADGEPITDFSDLLATIAFKDPKDDLQLTLIRDGQQQEETVTLAPRPEDFSLNQ